jgi:enoyl-CoA hydratase
MVSLETRSEENVRLVFHGHVALITLNRPERRNAFVPKMARKFIEVCRRIDERRDVGAVIVHGEGDAFCAGADRAILERAGTDPVAEENFADLGSVYEAFMRLGSLGPPVIAAVNGSAVGAGLNLALAADLRIVAEDARLIAGFLRIGIHPGGGHFSLLTRLVGREAAAALALFGEEITGADAVRLGLAWEAHPREEVLPRAMELASRVASDPELGRAATRTFRQMSASKVDWEVAMAAERSAQMWSLRRRAERKNESFN